MPRIECNGGLARNWAGLSYALGKAKALADRLGGLENTDEYKKVLADLDAVELTFDDAILDVAALNAKIQEKLTPEFLATVTEKNKLDMTSFITNPNIFNNTGVQNQMLVDGFSVGTMPVTTVFGVR